MTELDADEEEILHHVHFRISQEEYEAMVVYGKEQKITVSYIAHELLALGFDAWRKGANIKITNRAKRRFPKSKTSRGF